MALSALLALAVGYVKANLIPLVAGFVARHISAPVVAKTKAALAFVHGKVQAVLAFVHDKVQAVLAWVHSKL